MVDWKDIREDFVKEYYSSGKTYQQKWEEKGLTYQDAQEWIPLGFKLNDYDKVKQWKNLNFTSQQTQSWIKTGLTPADAEFAAYLRGKGYQPNQTLNLNQLKEEFNTPTNYLDFFYPKNQRNTVKNLNISQKNLTGNLDLSDFVNLEELNCGYNQLTSLNLNKNNQLTELIARDNILVNLDVSNCPNLVKIDCSNNKLINLDVNRNSQLTKLSCSNNVLTDFDFANLNPEKLTELWINDNNFSARDLSCFSHLINLEELIIGNEFDFSPERYNRFYGSLKHLWNLAKLERICVSNTDIDSGLEYLSNSCSWFWSSTEEKPNSKVAIIEKKLKIYYDESSHYMLSHWREANPQLIEKARKEVSQLQANLITTQQKKIKELKEELQLEREEAEKALEKAKEWREKQLKEITEQKDKEIGELKKQVSQLQSQLANLQVEQTAQIIHNSPKNN